MSYHDFPTHLGGELADLAWEDLTPHELALSAAGTTVKAGAVAMLAYEQAATALKQGDAAHYVAYRDIAEVLARASKHVTLIPSRKPLHQAELSLDTIRAL